MSDDKVHIFVSKAPTDPEEKKKWVNDMFSLQVSMWIKAGATCEECGHTYTSVDDFRKRQVHAGHTKKMTFVCSECYPEYKKNHPVKENSEETN